MGCTHDTVQRALCPMGRSSWRGRGRRLCPSPVQQAASSRVQRRHGEVSTGRCPRRRRCFPQGDDRKRWYHAGRGFVQPGNVKNGGGGLTLQTIPRPSPPPPFSTFPWSVRHHGRNDITFAISSVFKNGEFVTAVSRVAFRISPWAATKIPRM